MIKAASALLGSGLLLVGFSADAGPAPAPAGTPVPALVAEAVHELASRPLPVVTDDPLADDPVIAQYCARRCHNDRRLRGNLSLETFDTENPAAQGEVAEKIIHKLRAGMMPPPGSRRPEPEILDGVATALENRLDAEARERPNPGSRTFQRLNRAEYTRSIEDLLGLTVDVDAFLPTETMSENFDNIADVQMLSATLMEGYLRAAAHVSRVAVGDPTAGPSTTTYKVPKTASQMDRVAGAPYGTRGGISVVHNFPADGEYVFELELHPGPTGFLYGMTAPEETLEVSIDGERVAALKVDRWTDESDPTGMRVETDPIHLRAGPRRVTAAFVRTIEGPVDDLVQPVDYTLADTQIGSAYGVTTLPHLRDLGISGPFHVTGVSETPSRRRIFTCRPTALEEERPCAREIVERLGSQAYRRPLEETDVESLLGFYDLGTEEGGFEVGIRTALQAVLASPHFVFRLERVPEGVAAGQSYAIDPMDLASRLSFFLWGAPPDAELVAAAAAGELADEAGLVAHARRMLADPRSAALAPRFAAQWLRLQDLEKIHPDAQLFPYYDHTLADAMRRETELLFEHLVQSDGDLFELLTADYTWVNQRLARHYGIPGVTGDEMRRVDLPMEYRRGILGHGSILMMTSHANRTSPVLRGKWVMEVLMGSPPPPPPPDVPAFEETDEAVDGRSLTTRQRIEQHRANPTCNSCHRFIDPLGLALDNFDVTGAWRIKENGVPVDTNGELYDGMPITGPADLRAALLKRPSVFVRTFTRNLMAYALGRRVEWFDMPAVRRIERDAADHGNRMSSFVIGVVKSPAFRMGRIEAVAEQDPMGAQNQD